MLNHRLQVLIDEERYERLVRRAREREESVAEVVRRAIDAELGDDERRRAAKAILAAEPMAVPDPEELKAELDEIRSGGL